MSQIVIVAIPNKDDYVWNISSDKVPHMTLMNLGDDVKSLDVFAITNFLDHVVKTSMHRFGMDVDRRGELGDKKADVLFFGKHNLKMLETIRGYLLTNPDINKAYHSTDQFPTFVPHLTLGFPDNPAKKDKRDYPGTSWINFDRIALWTGEFTGPEYPLLSEESQMSMTDSVVDFLAHFGVKGMKWGVRKTSSGGKTGTATTDAQEADRSRQKIKTGGTHALTTKELQSLVNRMNLEQQYSRLISSQPTTLSRGHDHVRTALGLANTGVQVFNLANSAAAKAGFALVKTALAKA